MKGELTLNNARQTCHGCGVTVLNSDDVVIRPHRRRSAPAAGR